MAIVITNLTSGGSGTGATSFNTASITPTGNNLILLSTTARFAGGDPPQPTASGCGLTWVVVYSSVYFYSTSNHKRITVFRAMGASPSTGAVTISYGASTITHSSWVVDQASGVDTSGTNGSGAYLQAVGNIDNSGQTAFSIGLSAFSSSNNRPYGAFCDENGSGLTKGASFTLTAQGVAAGGNTIGEYANSEIDTLNVTDSPATGFGGVAFEIKAAVSAAVPVRGGLTLLGVGN